jgi:phosphoglycerate dehydrogenase-like enzyme
MLGTAHGRQRRIIGGAALLALAAAVGAEGAHAQAAPEVGRDVQTLIAEEGLQESARPASALIAGWQPKKIVVMVDSQPGRVVPLQEVAPGVRVVAVRTVQEAVAQVGDADGLVNSCDPQVMAAAKKLRWLQLMSAGVDYCLPYLKDRTGIVLTNFQRVHSDVLSDHVMAMMLALTRGLDLFVRQNVAGAMDASRVPPERMWQLRDRTLLVVGLGGIGTDVAAKAHAFGMHVIATRNSRRAAPDFVDDVGVADELPDLIGKADVVVMTAPLTAETAHLFDAAMFGRMKKGAIFINITRGGVVVQDDLIAALESGQLGAAGLDVTTPEPLPRNDPLFAAPNILLTPHVAGRASASGAGREEGWRVVRENLRRYVAGDKLYNLVDLARGY